MKSQILGRYILCPLCIVIAWFATATYTFNKKADLNGDNFYYYITASAMASGQGYVDLSKVDDPTTDVDERITATYPPGYPILMTPLRSITDSIIAQKWQNELCILASLLLLYFMLLRIGLSVPIAFISTFAGAFIPRVLHFSTMMMSESAFCLTAILVFYFLLRASENEDKWYSELRQPWIWLSIGCLIINYHVRTQGLALLAGVLFGLLIRRRWAAIGAMIGGFIVGYLPWKIRNQVLGLSNSRYLDMVMLSNPWRPEEGSLTITEFIGRFFETLKMLVFTALPNSILPFAECNPDQPEYSIGLYILGIVMIILIVVGCLQLGKIKWCVLGYIAATFGIISVFSTPSGNRYLTAIMPIMTMAELIGIYAIVTWAIQRITKRELTWSKTLIAFLLLPLLFLAKSGLQTEHQISNMRYPLPYAHFFHIGKDLKKKTPKDIVVCSRKPQMLYMYSERAGVGYLFTSNAEELIQDLINKKVDYVIFDALGYSSTGLYLYPAIQKYAQFFPIVQQYDATHTYLLRFNREEAKIYFAQQ